jgi:hypothetical protein
MNLTNLVDRRLRGDLIQMYRAINNIDKISWHHEPERKGITTRGHDQNLRREIVHHSLQRHNFFTNRAVEAWNQLDENAVNAKSMNEFKNKLKLFNENRLLRSNIYCC